MPASRKPISARSVLPPGNILFRKTALLARILAACGALVFSFGLEADPIVYTIGNNSQFGTMDVATGAFTKISDTPPIIQYLANGPNNSLLTMSFDGNLGSINPGTGAFSVVGPTGFGDCSGPAPANLSSCQLSFGQALGRYYATDFNNNLYTINPATGQAALVGRTGMPALTFVPGIPAADGSIDFYNSNLFEAGGKLYANYDAGHFQPPADPNSEPVFTVITAPSLYQIDPITGLATRIGDTTFGGTTIANINGTIYSFDGNDSSIRTLDVTTGLTTVIGHFDENVGLVSGVAAVPEPAPIALTCFGIGFLALSLRKCIPSRQ
jgi:hypothetical protein